MLYASEYHLSESSIVKPRPIILLFLLALQLGNIPPCYGQISVVREMIPRNDGPNFQAYFVTIPIGTLKKIQSRWNDYIGENAYGWESQKNGIHRQRGIIEKKVSSQKFAVSNEIVMTDLGVRLTIWFTQKRKPLVASKTGDKLDLAFKKYIHDFAVAEYRKAAQTQLKGAQHLKDKMEVELAALHQNQQRPRRAIGDGDYRAKTATIIKSIDMQNLKMQKLSGILDTVD